MDDAIKAAIGRQIQAAQVSDVNDTTRGELLEQYLGEPYGDEVKGRSAFVSTDISDAVEGLLPDLMDLFTSAENIAEFKPVGPEDEEAAKQETEVCHNIFWQQNNGYLLLYTAIKESLIQQNAYWKSGWEEKERVEVESYEDLTPEELQQVVGQIEGEIEVIESKGLDEQYRPIMTQPPGADPQTGQPTPPQFEPINIKVRITTVGKRYVIRAVPQEEIFISPRWPSLSLDGIPCCGHRQEIEVGELRRMGFSEDSIAKATDEDSQWSIADEARNDTEYHFDGEYAGEDDDSTRKVTVFEAYVRADINDDGRAELVKVWATGDGSTLLEWEDGTEAIEEVSGHPFSAFTPFIMPHRHVGRSLAEMVAPVQKVKTVLFRQTLDNLYLTNYARPEYDENMAGPFLARDLAQPGPGAQVRTGGAALNWRTPQPVIGATLPILEMMNGVAEQRTGSTRYSQGLQTEALNNTAASTVSQIMDASMKKRQLIARTIAETGIADLFRRMHRDLRSGPVREMAMRLRNEWVSINPRTWRYRNDLTISVGMGSGDRDEKRAFLMMVKQAQTELMASGSPMVDAEKLYNTAEKMAETFGVEDIGPYLNDPRTMPPPEDKGPDPTEQMMQMQMQALQADMQAKQADAQLKQMELQQKQQAQQLDVQLKQAEAARKQQESEVRFANERRALEMEHQRKMRELAFKEEQAAAGIQTDDMRLVLDRDRAIMEDDFKRDKLEVDAATGYMRDALKTVNSAPPMAYSQVGRNGN